MKGKPAPKISTKQMCRDYYELEIFGSNGDFEITVYAEIGKVDSSAIVIDTNVLIRELTALNVELFGFAWFEHNYELCLSKEQQQDQADSALCTEITFTKSYLEQTGNGDIWNAAGFYNDTILQATIAQKTSMDWSIPRDIPSYYKRGVHSSSETESEKLIFESLRERFDKLLTDKECALRLGNRFVSVHTWRDGIMIPQKLSSAFAQRLNFSPNSEALLLLQRLTVGLYNNARNYIDAVKDYGSWELARKESGNLMKHIVRGVQKDMESEKRSEN